MNPPLKPLANDDRTERPASRRGLWLAAVIAGHGLLLAAGHVGLALYHPPLERPRVIGMLLSPPVAAVAPPKPQKQAAPSKPRPKTRPAAKPKPAPALPAPPGPPSERALTPPPAPETPAVPLEDVAPGATETEGLANASESVAQADSGPPSEAPIELPRTDAAHLNNPTPAYPSLSRRFGEEGRVLLDVYILEDGRVGEIKLNRSSGFARLDHAALETVRHWRFMPARRGGEAIPFWYVQPITFSLDR
ncbi:transport protein TonB [compost metagenome]